MDNFRKTHKFTKLKSIMDDKSKAKWNRIKFNTKIFFYHSEKFILKVGL